MDLDWRHRDLDGLLGGEIIRLRKVGGDQLKVREGGGGIGSSPTPFSGRDPPWLPKIISTRLEIPKFTQRVQQTARSST